MNKILSSSTNVRYGIAEASALPQVSSLFQPAASLWRLGIGHSNTTGLCGVCTGDSPGSPRALCPGRSLLKAEFAMGNPFFSML